MLLVSENGNMICWF